MRNFFKVFMAVSVELSTISMNTIYLLLTDEDAKNFFRLWYDGKQQL